MIESRTGVRIATAVALGLTAIALVALGAGVLGVLWPGLPILGLATGFLPPAMSWIVLAALACGLFALGVWWRRRGRVPVVLVVVALVIAAGGGVVTARMVSAVESAGADIDLADTLRVFTKPGAEPDATLTYTTYDGEPVQLSVYRPRTAARPAPVLTYIHGGGWIAGDRDARSTDFRWFADEGWLVVTVDYSLSSRDRHLWNVVPEQMGCALAWVNGNAAKYGGDPARLSLSGDSAGGNLAINTAYLRARGELRSSCGGTLPVVSAVSATYPVVDLADFHDNPDTQLGATSRAMAAEYVGGSPEQYPERYAAIASATHLSPAAPPTLLIVGAEDHLVPVGATHHFADTARAAGVDVELVSVPYSDHVFDVRAGSIGQQAYRQITAQWLRAQGQAP